MEPTDLRLALFTGNYNITRDGANQALNRLVDFLLRRSVAVRVYSPVARKAAFSPAGDLVNVPAIPFPGRSEYRLPLGVTLPVRRDLTRFQPTLFHVSSPEFLGHGAVALGRRWDVPVVASVHTRFETYPRYYGLTFLEPLVEATLRRFYRRCDAIFAPSESMAQLLREQRMSFDVGIWSRGVDRDLFAPERRDPAWRRSLGIGDDEIAIGFVGRLVMEKGLDVFADAIDELDRRGVHARILVIGEGPAQGWFQRRLPQAVFAGFQRGADLGRAVASADMLFNPSVTETFGNVTLEAMAAGIAVVAARATGSENLVTDGVTGRLVRPGAISAFADALETYAKDADARTAAGAAGRRASERYGWDQVNQHLLDSYLRIARQRSQGGGAPRLGRAP